MKNQQQLFEGYELPITNIQEVLLTLITKGHTSFFDFSYMQGYRTRVSDLVLKHNIQLETIKNSRCNKFGNKYTYHIHKLPEDQKEKAINVYKKMFKL